MEGKRVLIIEDDMRAAEVLEAYLKESVLLLLKWVMVLKASRWFFLAT
jgi:response regulator of citrate/malate metabolism